MFKNFAVLALLGHVSADQIPLSKKDLTQEMFDNQVIALGDPKVALKNYNDSEYYVDINVGTPGQKITVVPDTASSNLWVLGSGCTIFNGCKGKTVYKSKSSSTFKKNGAKIAIADDVQGIISNDVVNLGGVNSKMDFAEIGKPSKNEFGDKSVTGVLGLGFPAAIIGGIEKTFMDQVDSEDKSFEINLHKNPEESYLMIPGKDFGESNGHDTHYIVEKHYWGIHIDYLQQGTEHKILTPKHLITLDTSSSLIHGPKEVISLLIAGIEVAADCSNLDSLPPLHFALDGLAYTLTGNDYVQKVGTTCQMGVVATEATDKYIHLGTQFITKYSPVYFNYG